MTYFLPKAIVYQDSVITTGFTLQSDNQDSIFAKALKFHSRQEIGSCILVDAEKHKFSRTLKINLTYFSVNDGWEEKSKEIILDIDSKVTQAVKSSKLLSHGIKNLIIETTKDYEDKSYDAEVFTHYIRDSDIIVFGNLRFAQF